MAENEFATLVVKVDGEEVGKADKQLKEFTKTVEGAENALEAMGKASKVFTAAARAASEAERAAAAQERAAAKQAAAVEKAAKAAEKEQKLREAALSKLDAYITKQELALAGRVAAEKKAQEKSAAAQAAAAAKAEAAAKRAADAAEKQAARKAAAEERAAARAAAEAQRLADKQAKEAARAAAAIEKEADRKASAAAKAAARAEAAANKAAEAERKAIAKSMAALDAYLTKQEKAIAKRLAAEDALAQKQKKLSEASKAAFSTGKDVTDRTELEVKALERHRIAMDRAGMSAKQYQQAMRYLPMQLTDVVTSLASGMPIWMIAIQQGGQIKDSFGGAGNAMRGLAEAVRNSISAMGPLGVSVAAAAVAAGIATAAFAAGQREIAGYAQAITLTGNSVGLTTQQLNAYAEQLDAANGTQGSAAETLTRIASGAKISGENVLAVGKAAQAMSYATGAEVDSVVGDFERLQEAPLKTALTLQKTTGAFTDETLNQIRALEEQGKAAEAAKLAISAYSEELQKRSGKIVESMGYLDKAAKAASAGLKEVWDGIKDIGRETSAEERIKRLTEEQQILSGWIEKNSDTTSSVEVTQADRQRLLTLNLQIEALKRQKQLSDEAAGAETEKKTKSLEGQAAQERLNAILKEQESDAKKLADAYAKLDKDLKAAAETGKTYTDEQIAALRLAAEQSIGSTRTQAQEYLQGLREQVRGNQAVTEAARIRMELETGKYKSLDAATKARLTNLASEVDLLNKLQSAADQAKNKADQAQEAALEAQKEISQRYEQQRDALSGSSVGQSFLGASSLRDQASRALNSRDADEAIRKAQQAAEILRQLQQSGESTVGFEGLLNGLERIEKQAQQIKLEDLQRSAKEATEQADTLRANLEERLKPNIVPAITDDAQTQAVAAAQTLAEQLKAALTVPITIIGPSGEVISAGAQADTQTGFASGGWTGPGSKYQPAGIVHANEHVMPSEVVSEPGALPFLERMRRSGFAATMESIMRNGYASGGLVSPLSPVSQSSLPSSPSQAQMQSLGTMIFEIGGASIPVIAGNDTVRALELAKLKRGIRGRS